MPEFAPGDWIRLAAAGKLGRIVDVQKGWGHLTYRVWLPTDNVVTRANADELARVTDVTKADANQIAYVVAAGRIVDALSRDVLLAPLEASVIPLPHQVRVLQRATAGDRVRFLLADEVGLGKTIEAGLILRELKLRGLVRRVLVVAPKGLVPQWVSEMRDRFGEEFQIVDGQRVRLMSDLALPAALNESSGGTLNAWRAFDQVICSLDAVKPIESHRGWSREQVARYNRERFEDLVSAGWDLVVVDEAHRLAGATDDVARFRLGQGLSGAAPYLLLLSATPHQGKTDGFQRLLSLLDPDEFPDAVSVTRERVRRYVIRTEKRRTIDARGQPLFQPRHTRFVPIAWEERHHRQRVLYDAVSDYVREGYNQAIREKRPYVGFLLLLMQRLVTSSTHAIRVTLERRLEALSSTDDAPSDDSLVSRDPLVEVTDESEGEENFQTVIASRVAARANERAEVGILLDLARAAEAAGPDPKAEALLDWIYRLQREEGNPDVKILVFTEFVPTQEMLYGFLADRGFAVVCLNGSLEGDERRRVQVRFATDAQVLVSTDAGGEGLNLQFCHVIVNYDLPWNPMRLEQRIGRVDRIGQTRPVEALNLALADTVEHRVQEVLTKKLAVILEEFGVDKTADVLDSTQAAALFDDLYRAGISNPERIAEDAAALAERVRVEAEAAQLTGELLADDADLDPEAARRFLDHPLPRWVERMVTSYLRANGGNPERRDGIWRLSWPDSGITQDNVVFSASEVTSIPNAAQLTLDEPRVRQLVTRLPPFVDGQPIPSVGLPTLPATVQGYWSLWRIALHAADVSRERILVLFVHDNGKVYVPTAQRIWDLLLSESVDLRDAIGAGAVETYNRLRHEAEIHGRAIYDDLRLEHLDRLKREVEKREYAFAARSRAIERIGLVSVRAHRLSALEGERQAWRAELERKAETNPELQALVILRVNGGEPRE